MNSADPSLCRDCLGRAPPRIVNGANRCAACGSPRILRHAELEALAIAHIDCDAFYASVEKRDDPALAGRPVIVGGGVRGVVLACCYTARLSGVRSAMPMRRALALCPQAAVVRPRMAVYAETGRAIRGAMQALTPLVEAVSIDEAYLDLAGTERLFGRPPAATLAAFVAEMERAHGITLSVGLSHAKTLAKLASDMDKPRGFRLIGRAETLAMLAPLPVERLHGVGEALAAKLKRAGFTQVGQLQALDADTLAARFGEAGAMLWRRATGQDRSAVSPGRATKSISAETTFDQDKARAEEIEPILWRLAERLAARLKAAGLGAGGVVLKLKRSDFQLLTRRAMLEEPTQLAPILHEGAVRLLRDTLDGRTRYRLVGIGTTGLVAAEAADAGSLLDPGRARLKRLEGAVDAIRSRHGAEAIGRGRGKG